MGDRVTTGAPGPERARPDFLGVLRDGPYRRLWLSGLCLATARWMDMVVLGWLAFAFTGSPFMVGVAAFVRSAPMMALGPVAGLVADRVPRGRVLLATQSLGAVTALALAAVFAAGRGGYAPLVGLAGLFGVAWALDFPARRTALYALVGPGRVASAVSLETVSMQLAKMLGPLLAGIGLARLGPAACFAGVAALYAIGLGATRGLGARIGGPARPAAAAAASLAAGVRAAWREPTVRGVLLVTVLMNVLFFPYQHMLPVFARDVLAVGPEWLGGLIAADGLGALLGALAIASRGGFLPHRRVFAGAVTVAPVLLVALAGARWRWACAAILVLMGAAESGFATMQSTLVLLAAPEGARGGAMGILSACIGTQPLGTLWIGVLASGIGVPAAMAGNAAVALAALLPLAWRLWRAAGRPPGGPAAG
jgi:MFS family permease